MPPKSQEEPRVWTVAQVLKWTQERFVAAGLRSPRLDTELLLSHGLGWPRMSLYTRYDQALEKEELGAIRELIRRRLSGESVAYLTGQKEFWSLQLRVSPAVLVPRPETETLVEAALALLDGTRPERGGDLTVHYDEVFPETRELIEGEGEGEAPEPGAAAPAAVAAPEPAPAPSEPGPLVADIGTGSGAVALALKKERPAARLFAVDRSEEALAVARDNGARLGLAVEFLPGDLLAPLAGMGFFDLIVSNPPYIPTGDLRGLPPEVRAEPQLALDGGPDGLSVIRRLVTGAREHLLPGGALALEVGDGQAAAVAELLARAGYEEIEVRADLARMPRVVSGRRPR